MSSAQHTSNRLLTSAVDQQASDLHFYPLPDKIELFFRINGKRLWQEDIPIEIYELLLTYYKFTSGMDIGETRKPQNGTIEFHANHTTYSLRLSTLPANYMESLAIRVLPQEKQHTLDELLLFPFQKDHLTKLVNMRSGLILLTGPTGCGKTTTLYALLQSILQHNSYQTITLEDPIEKNMNDILQVQVNEKAGVTYQVGLKAALRHDPDIIMVGEIRDRHTAHFAFEAALTGHLVLSTLHAKDAPGTIYRLLDMGLTKADIRQSLIAIASLKLLPIGFKQTINRRAAILELLNSKELEILLNDQKVGRTSGYQSFSHLRKKAYAYGFISQDTLSQE